MKLTANTIATASISTPTNSLTELATATGCSAADPVAEAEYYMDLSDDPMAASAVELATVDGEPWGFTDTADGRLTLPTLAAAARHLR